MTVDLVVMGLGHVGLPLARAAVSAGLTTAGYDVSGTVVSAHRGPLARRWRP